ncbi:hypothetical protein N7499_000340 [Penicillium canescens]|uniref:Yeast cell wall synthesis Kre9/Knh1-like N-terminal domain-containing protein n=1 Tax=Penicillium canescens TaxID=5083 RepID=A0AAD6IGM7_PENCN|nr:uncharacterized protein N7446_011460 [Penicillium canescens]KAJ6004271.1 hypothetical protein N7522_005916 [Penicillium canescens]KAJ6029195.1 hypothetical protein N7444_012182 [Penicillium canescens]KAJ6047626.1 hypothetical protein N7460_003773 [Penicillium canescens]KAJ6048777.1 hypothetical protein N7446_011460 [Penicillium canescens]KAJ6100710.1 hypothetical protein N7499_000340 [Penicillium canescens]
MRLSLALSVLPLALSVSALKVTEPEQGAMIDTSDSLVVKWTSVDTDETSFNVFLVNNNVYPPVHKKIGSDIKTSEHSYTIDSLSGVTDAKGYQINLESTSEHNTGILAQSNQFNVTESASSSSTSTGASSSASSAATSGSATASSTESSSSSSVSTTHTSAGTSTSTKSGSSTTATGATTTASGTSTASSMTTATSASGSASGTASASATPSTGAGVALGAAPVAVGLLAGVLALGL